MSELKPIKDILKDAFKNQLRNEFVEAQKMKLVRDAVLRIPTKPANIPRIAAAMIKQHIVMTQQQVGEGIEVMVVLLLSIDNFPINTFTIGIGNEDEVHFKNRTVFSYVLDPRFNARGFIMGHNHRSGLMLMSPDDRQTMERFKWLGEEMETPLCDFIIVSDTTDEYYSHGNETYELR